MQTKLDSTQRVFQVVCQNTGKQFFCNIHDLDRYLNESGFVNYKVYHFWNNKPKLASKKLIKEMKKAAGYEVIHVMYKAPFHRATGYYAIIDENDWSYTAIRVDIDSGNPIHQLKSIINKKHSGLSRTNKRVQL